MNVINVTLVLSVMLVTALGVYQAERVYSDSMARTLGLTGPNHEPD